jgi:hypothetical protein
MEMTPIQTQTLAPVSTVEWSPIIAGTLLACAVSAILTHFGNGLGLSFTNLKSDDLVTAHSVFALGLWLLWTQISASLMGGYLAGRMLSPWGAGHESELRDGAHGLIVWALSTVLTALVVGAAAAVAALAVNHGIDHPELSHETAKKLGIVSGFALLASSLVSAVIAWYMATLGGDHRDRKVDARGHYSFRRR